MQYFRSMVFTTYMVAATIVYATILTLMLPLPLRYHYKVACSWAKHLFRAAKLLCNLDYVIEGRENLPDEPTVVYYKHSSAWEAIQVFTMFPTQCWVINAAAGCREFFIAPMDRTMSAAAASRAPGCMRTL